MDTSDPFDISSQDIARANAHERALLAAQIEVDDMKWLMSNKRGRRFVSRLLEQAGVWRISFNTNALTMAFNEGARNGGLRLVSQLLTHCPDHYASMLKEQQA